MDIDWPTTIPYKLQQTCYAKTTSCKEKKSKKKTNFFCHLLRADPNVLLIKAETTRPHYSSSLSLSPILLPSLQRHERVVFRTVAGHACPRVLYLPSFSRTFHSSLLVTPSGCLCSSHRLFPSITGFALHARTTTHGTHGDAFSHHLRSLSSNSLPSRSIKFFFLLIRLHPRVFYRRQLS